jgi:hypothetical protein
MIHALTPSRAPATTGALVLGRVLAANLGLTSGDAAKIIAHILVDQRQRAAQGCL